MPPVPRGISPLHGMDIQLCMDIPKEVGVFTFRTTFSTRFHEQCCFDVKSVVDSNYQEVPGPLGNEVNPGWPDMMALAPAHLSLLSPRAKATHPSFFSIC